MNVITDNSYHQIMNEIDQLFIEDRSGSFETSIISNKKTIHCSDDEFYYIVDFPNLDLSFLSPHFASLFGYQNINLSLKSFLKLVHPEDQTLVSASCKNICQFILNNIHTLKPGANILSLEFRFKHQNGEYIKVYNNNFLHEKSNWNRDFKLLSHYTLIDSACGKESTISHSLKKKPYNFTQRELEILHLLALGKSSYETGLLLNITKHTVDTHRRKMLSKSKFSNTAELVAYSISKGLIEEYQ